MPFQREVLSPCLSCKALSAEVIETRSTSVSTRRRKQCRDCGYKFTTHEVLEEYFQESKINRMLISRVRKAMELSPATEETEESTSASQHVEILTVEEEEEELVYKCVNCAHMMHNVCTLGIPEFNTDEANECVYYVVDEHNLLTAFGINVPTP